LVLVTFAAADWDAGALAVALLVVVAGRLTFAVYALQAVVRIALVVAVAVAITVAVSVTIAITVNVAVAIAVAAIITSKAHAKGQNGQKR
jgi:hypothetical protein